MRSLLMILLFCGVSPGLWAESGLSAQAVSPAASVNEAVLNSYYAALNQGDIEAAVAFLDESFTSDAAMPAVKKGREGFEASLKALRVGFPDSNIEVLEFISQGDTTAVRYRFSGTQRGKLYGLKATKKKVKVTGMDFWKFKDGKILEQHGNFDALGMLVQLGIAPQLQ